MTVPYLQLVGLSVSAFIFYGLGQLVRSRALLWAVLSIVASLLAVKFLRWGLGGILLAQGALFAGISFYRLYHTGWEGVWNKRRLREQIRPQPPWGEYIIMSGIVPLGTVAYSVLAFDTIDRRFGEATALTLLCVVTGSLVLIGSDMRRYLSPLKVLLIGGASWLAAFALIFWTVTHL